MQYLHSRQLNFANNSSFCTFEPIYVMYRYLRNVFLTSMQKFSMHVTLDLFKCTICRWCQPLSLPLEQSVVQWKQIDLNLPTCPLVCLGRTPTIQGQQQCRPPFHILWPVSLWGWNYMRCELYFGGWDQYYFLHIWSVFGIVARN